MPGVLKLPAISPLYNSPISRPNWARFISSSTASAAPTTVSSSSTQRRLNHSSSTTLGWWWSRITTNLPPGRCKIDNPYHQLRPVGFPCRKNFCSSLASEGKSQSQPNNCSSGTGGMGATYASDSETKDKNYQDGIRPPPTNSNKLLTLPTMLTIGRVASVPLLISTFYANNWWGPNATTVIFIAAAVTDWLDGYLARKMKLGTAFGAFLDPVADKLMVAATLILLCTRPIEVGFLGQAPWLLTVPAIAIIGREITMSAVREWAASQDSKLSEAVAVNNLGKWKTATQMTALTILLAARDSSLIGSGTVAASGVVLLYISAWLSVWSLVVYMRKIWKFLV